MAIKGLSKEINSIVGNQHQPAAAYSVLIAHLDPESILYDPELDTDADRILLIKSGIEALLKLYPTAKADHEAFIAEIHKSRAERL